MKLKRLFSTILTLGVFLAAQSGLAEEVRNILVRNISTTWCGSCQELKKAMLEKNLIAQSKSNVAYYMGSAKITVDGKEYPVVLETVEVDHGDAKKLQLTPAIDDAVEYVPMTQIYLNEAKLHQEFWAYMARDLGVTVDQSDIGGTFVRVIEAFFTKTRP